MRITYDPAKRAQTLASRNLDFADAWKVFTGRRFIVRDKRRNYDEPRYLCYGELNVRLMLVGFTPRDGSRHVSQRGKPMPEKKDAISLSYETNFEELDAHEIQPEEYEDAPELTDEMFRQGTLMHGEQEIYSFPKELIMAERLHDI